MSDQWQQQEDLDEQEQKALGCLIVIYLDHAETADALAPLLGIGKLWQQTKEQFNAHARTARVG